MLYRKYRPQTFDQVIGQTHVVKSLQGGLQNGRIGHAYLFAGPRGTGKTTIARIFAKALNCADFSKNPKNAPCGKCDVCKSIENGNSLDLIEIDAASNRGIDEIRNLKESAFTAAPGGGYKIFVVDEVHALTKDAFNALLKIIEEPPDHVVFVLATTEPHKILPTVLSRVQRFDFKRLTSNEIYSKLVSVAKSEKVQVDEEGLRAIAISSDGALRDAEVALTKILSSVQNGKVSADEVNKILGLIPLNFYPEFLGCLISADKPGALGFIQNIYHGGIDLENFSKEFLEYLRRLLIYKISPATLASVDGELPPRDVTLAKSVEPKMLVRMIQLFTNARIQIKSSPIPPLPLELAVFDLLQSE